MSVVYQENSLIIEAEGLKIVHSPLIVEQIKFALLGPPPPPQGEFEWQITSKGSVRANYLPRPSSVNYRIKIKRGSD